MALFRRLTSFSKSKKNSEEGKASGIANGTKANGTEPNDTKTNDTKTNDTKTNDTKTNGTKTSIVSQPATAAKSNLTNGYVPATVMEEEEEQPKEDAQAVTQGDVQAVTRADVARTFEEFAQLIHASRRPLPKQSGDGAYLEKEEPSGFWDDMRSLGVKDLATVKHIIEDKASGKPQDDRKMHMEEIMQLVGALPTKSANRVELTSLFLDELWNSLEHPPLSYLGEEFRYRSADGSRNSYMFPKLGAANTPYARSVNPLTVQPGALPDPGLIFDSVFARQEFKPHPNGVSSIFFNWASLVIHDLFQTDHHDYSISKTSSYLDLSTLYGDVQEDQDQMRTFKDGKIKPDCFSESRLLAFPPACGTMLIMLNRFHNYVVEQLAMVNENGRFTKPSENLEGERAEKAWKKYDNDLFQTGRLIVCGLYINITLHDYLRTIVNLNSTNSTWTLDPRLEKDHLPGKARTPRGTGNQVSAEFNLAYRWHSCIGELDEKWTENVYHELFGKEAVDVSMAELMVGLKKYDEHMPKDPMERPFAHLKRGEDGKFADDDLVKIMQTGVEEVAGAFGARNVPKCLRAISILGMKQARAWNCGSLNEFRKFFGLKTYDTFEEINPDPYVAEQLKHLYEHPDFVELYPGIATEATKEPMIPGVGIAPTYTISRAVLSDAVALVRGDRFYTIDYNPKNLTNWGYSEVQYDLSINQGCVFYKLCLRAFPNHFKPDSIYAHYPMTTPTKNASIMKNLGRYDDYSWEPPARIPERINLTSYAAAQRILNNKHEFNVMWTEGFGHIMGKGGLDFMLAGDTQFHTKQRDLMHKNLYRDEWHKHVKEFYQQITLQLLQQKSCKIAGINQVDLTRDVGNLAHVHFAANIFSLPLKTEENPRGIFSEQELWMLMSVIFTAIFFDFEPTKSFPLRMVAQKLATMLGKLIEAYVTGVTATSFAPNLIDGFRENRNALADYGIHMIRRLVESGLAPYEIAFSQVMPTAIAMVPNQSQVFTQIMDYYLGVGSKHLPEINRLAKIDNAETDEKLLHYAMEGIRLNGTFGSYRRSTVSTTVTDGDAQVPIKPGDKVFVSFVSAARDPSVFPNPEEVVIDRPIEKYIHYGIGEHSCLGKEASMVALTAMLRTVGKLDGLRRAPGPQGELKKIPRPGGFYVFMREDQGSYFVFPCTMKVHYDGVLPSGKEVVNSV